MANARRVFLDEKRSRLQKAALSVIARDGVEKASTRAITSEAKQNQASIHYAFASKDALLMSLPDIIQKDVQAVLAKALVGCTNAPMAIRKVATTYWAHTLSDPDLQRVQYELALFSLSKPEYKNVAKQQYAQYRNVFTDVLTVFLKDTMNTTDIEALANTCISLLDGIILQYLATQDETGCARALELGIQAMQGMCGSGMNS